MLPDTPTPAPTGGDADETETCEFARYDREGEVLLECERTDYEIVSIADEGDVRLCPEHRSWVVAMGSYE